MKKGTLYGSIAKVFRFAFSDQHTNKGAKVIKTKLM